MGESAQNERRERLGGETRGVKESNRSTSPEIIFQPRARRPNSDERPDFNDEIESGSKTVEYCDSQDGLEAQNQALRVELERLRAEKAAECVRGAAEAFLGGLTTPSYRDAHGNQVIRVETSTLGEETLPKVKVWDKDELIRLEVEWIEYKRRCQERNRSVPPITAAFERRVIQGHVLRVLKGDWDLFTEKYVWAEIGKAQDPSWRVD